VRETRLSPDNFIYPLFVVPGKGQRREVGSMPGVFQLSVDEVVKEAAAAKADGVPGVLLFGLPESKGRRRIGGRRPRGSGPSAVCALKKEIPGLLVVTDICLCEYTSHGHCGIRRRRDIANDATVEELARCALTHASAGADIVAPSDMMERPRRTHPREARRRRALAGRDHSYAAKYCSAF
jgi:porphobilinogen synthase